MERFRYWYTVLLVALVLLMIAAPISEAMGWGLHRIATGFFVVMLIAAVPAVSHSRRAMNVTLLFAAPAILLHGLQELDGLFPALGNDRLAIAADLCSILFLGHIVVVSLVYLFRARRVTTDSLSAAICIYLLIGVIWASVYAALDRVDPQAISYPAEGTVEPRLAKSSANATLYYSFVTMTTLGYGDIVPRSSIARTCAIMQALMGQLYLTVLVARMVALHIVHEREEEGGGGRRKDEGGRMKGEG